ncbi:hypothetical protein CC1G_10568 [Coprinopsis cinerea okayama7|uniref:NAD(P)-binding domain-containing protein n=1 Tax=Coprinopsis cinerea (strain Okayama-7 / 130 / ATCC MYA-4618 / FGSC 9003) TaxID=240176 RepID=A8NDY2_COPC7|nr:hypothetical protein CC1G_10568 [Coprinopsis cinerea okayama7\|eukprot:XP_001832892.1 hypothetical protein CC1G_10568 [Coprinopsis cinerea okayama7\
MAGLNVFIIGGSRNIGYHSSILLLDAGATVTYLLRNTSVFDTDDKVQKYIKEGKARLVKGDALVQSDVQGAWDEASKESKVDVVIFTVGGTPKFSLTKGFVIEPANLVTQSLFNVLCVIFKHNPSAEDQPRIIAISSTGVTKASHDALPFALKPMYSYLLKVPHQDKIGAERLVAHCAGWEWTSGEPAVEIMGGSDWKNREGLPKPGELKKILVIRPALLTDGECKCVYRVSTGEVGGWTVSRKDVAHFLVDAVLKEERWKEFENKIASIAY